MLGYSVWKSATTSERNSPIAKLDDRTAVQRSHSAMIPKRSQNDHSTSGDTLKGSGITLSDRKAQLTKYDMIDSFDLQTLK